MAASNEDKANTRYWEFPDEEDEYASVPMGALNRQGSDRSPDSNGSRSGEWGIKHEEEFKFMGVNPGRSLKSNKFTSVHGFTAPLGGTPVPPLRPEVNAGSGRSTNSSRSTPEGMLDKEGEFRGSAMLGEILANMGAEDVLMGDDENEDDEEIQELGDIRAFGDWKRESRESRGEQGGRASSPHLLPASMSNRARKSDLTLDQERVIMDSIGVQFHLEVFLIQFTAHMLLPFAFVLINARIQGFWRSSLTQTFYNVVTPLLLYLSLVSYMMSPSSDKALVSGAVWITLIYYIQHKLTIALKYASLSETEYDRFQGCRDLSLAERFFLQIQLSRGWMERDPHLVRFELGCAGSRIGAKINEIHFLIEPPSAGPAARTQFAHWNALIRGNSTVQFNRKPAAEFVRQPDGSLCISVYDVALGIVRKTDSQLHGTARAMEQLCMYLFSFMNMALPLMKVAQETSPSDRSRWLYVFLGCSTVLNFVYFSTMAKLLYVGVWDTWQQWESVKFLHQLIRLSDLTLDTDFTLVMNRSKRLEEQLQHKRETASGNSNKIFSVTKPNRRRLSSVFQNNKEWQELLKDPPLPPPPHLTRNTSPRPSTFNSSRFFEFGNKNLFDGDTAYAPRLQMRSSQNVVAWTYLRLIFQHFGERFRARIDFYIGRGTGELISLSHPLSPSLSPLPHSLSRPSHYLSPLPLPLCSTHNTPRRRSSAYVRLDAKRRYLHRPSGCLPNSLLYPIDAVHMYDIHILSCLHDAGGDHQRAAVHTGVSTYNTYYPNMATSDYSIVQLS
ncbi:hypothetical protein B484DRAFT_209024 [Ochromonadaceae sp. CCMP2298]|nr:hypothetical protein B484DRAFT_209024 [Ochromonadaceae sp. CCMP2298]